MLGTGLATATAQPSSVPGVEAGGSENGAKIDPAALQQLIGGTSTTRPSTSTTRGTGVGHKSSTTTVPKTSTTHPTVTPAHVLGIGDSVMLGASTSLARRFPAWPSTRSRAASSAKPSRSCSSTRVLGALPTTLVIHLGTNGRITDDAFNQMMQAIGPGHQVYFLTTRVPRLWETEVNAALHSGAARWKNVHILEWHNFSTCHADWFVEDGFHLRTEGQHEYANFVRLGLLGQAPTICK